MAQKENPQEVLPGWYLPDKPKNRLSEILSTIMGFLLLFVLEVIFLGTILSAWIRWVILGWIFNTQ